MKLRNLTIILALLCTTLTISAKHVKGQEPNLSDVDSNPDYLHLVGARYVNGNVKGIIYFVSKDHKRVKIIPYNPTMCSTETYLSYQDATLELGKYGFQLPTREEARKIFKNMELMRWNMNYTDADGVRWSLPSGDANIYWTRTTHISGNITACYRDNPDQDEWVTEVRKYGDLRRMGYIGTKTIPFDMRYIFPSYYSLGINGK